MLEAEQRGEARGRSEGEVRGRTAERTESHLHEKLDLDTIAGAVHYSKYHLHRMFADTVGLTIHDYVQRRQLTEAAKLLVLSDQPILEIVLSADRKSVV